MAGLRQDGGGDAELSRLIAAAAEPLPPLEDAAAVRRAVRPLRRGVARGAARGGDARHERVLPRPRRHHPQAGRAARLQHRGAGGGLAGRGAGGPMGARSPAGRAGGRPGLRALPDLDVAQRGDAGLLRVAARPQRRAPAGAARRRPRPRHLLARRLHRSGAGLPRRGRSGGGAGGAAALRLPHAMAGGAGRLRARRAVRRARALRGGRRRAAPRPAGGAAAAGGRRPGSPVRRDAERARGALGGGSTTG